MMSHAALLLTLPFLAVLLSLSTKRKHFLMILLTLEALVLLTTVFILYSSTLSLSNSPFLSIFVLTMAATEATIGLSLLVNMSRQSGSDLMASTTQLKC